MKRDISLVSTHLNRVFVKFSEVSAGRFRLLVFTIFREADIDTVKYLQVSTSFAIFKRKKSLSNFNECACLNFD